MGRRPKITKDLIKKAGELAEAGFSHKQIYESQQISKAAFYANKDLVDTVKKAEEELRNKVSKALLNTAVGGDTTALIFLAKRLNLYSNPIDIDVKDSKTALEGLSKLINADLPIEQKNSLKGIIESYLKGFESVELEERIKKLEEQRNENN